MKTHLPLSLRRAILLCIFPVLSVSEAAPTNPDIKHGDITINTNGNATTVNQASHFGIIEWDSFNLGASDTVDFNFTLGKEAFSLNRITDDNASTIMGSIRSNGNVFLVNTSGIVFGEGSSVDVAGFAASTLDISDGDFLAENFTFSQKDGVDPSFIINKGSIKAADEGFIVLMAPKIENAETGKLYIARQGTIAMGSGQKATLSFQSSGLINFEVTEEVEKNVLRDGEDVGAGIENSGTVSANGGHVIMTASAKREVVTSVINNKGKIEANSIDSLLGAPRHSGKVTISSKGGTFKNEKGAQITAKTLDNDPDGGTVDIAATGDIEQNGTIDVTHESGVNSFLFLTSEDGAIYGSEDGLIIAHKAILTAISTTAGGVGLSTIVTDGDGNQQLSIAPLYTDASSVSVYTQSMDKEDTFVTGNVAIKNVSTEDLHVLINTSTDIAAQPETNKHALAHVEIETQGAITGGNIIAFSAKILAQNGVNTHTSLNMLEVDNFNSGDIEIHNHTDTLSLGKIYAREKGSIFDASDMGENTNEIKITQQGDLLLMDTISAAYLIYLTSETASIRNAEAFDNELQEVLVSNAIYLKAAGAVGSDGFEINVEIGNGFANYSDHGLNIEAGKVDVLSGDETITHSGVAINSSQNITLASLKLADDDVDISFNSENGDIIIKNDITCSGNAVFSANKGSIIVETKKTITATESLTMSALKNIVSSDNLFYISTKRINAESIEGGFTAQSTGADDLVVDVRAKDHIYIDHVSESGNLYIEQVESEGSIMLFANKDILAYQHESSLESYVSGCGLVSFTSHQGNIGSEDSPLNVAVHKYNDEPFPRLSASSAESIYINNTGYEDFELLLSTKNSFITSESSVILSNINAEFLDITSRFDLYSRGEKVNVNSLIAKARSFGAVGELHGIPLVSDEIDITTELGDCNIIVLDKVARINNINAHGNVDINAFVDTTLVHINSYVYDTTINSTGTLNIATIPASSYHIESNIINITAANLSYENDSDPTLHTNSHHLHLHVGRDSQVHRAQSTGNFTLHLDSYNKYENVVYEITAKNIFIADNNGATTVFKNAVILDFHATDGNIVFLNTNDTIVLQGPYETAVDFLAEGYTSLTGMMVLGNILTQGQHISLEAKSHISIAQLNTAYNDPIVMGDVYILSHNGAILDNNGVAENIVARNVELSAHAKGYESLLMELSALESYYGSLQLNLNSAESVLKLATYDFNAATTNITFLDNYIKDLLLQLNAKAGERNELHDQYNKSYNEYVAAVKSGDEDASFFTGVRVFGDLLSMIPEVGAVLGGVLDILAAFTEGSMDDQIEAASKTMQENKAKYDEASIEYKEIMQNWEIANFNHDSTSATVTNSYMAKQEAELRVAQIVEEQSATRQLLGLSQLASQSQAAIGSSSNSLDIRAENVTIHTSAASSTANASVYINTVGDTGIKEIVAGGVNGSVYISSDDDIHLQGSIKADKDVILRSTAGAILSDENSSIRASDLITLQAAGDVHVPKELTVTLSANPYAPVARNLIELISTGGSIIGDNINGSAAHGITARKLYAEAGTGITNLLTHVESIEALTTTGGIEIEQMGDVILELLSAPEGVVTFTATDGAITGIVLPYRDATIVGESLDIYAHGNIGEDDAHLLISVDMVSGAKSETGHIYIEDIDDLIVHQLSASNVHLTLSGSLSAANANSDVVADHIHLTVGDELHPDTWDSIFDNHEEDHLSIYLNNNLIGGSWSSDSQILEDQSTLNRPAISGSPFMRPDSVLFPNSVYSDLGFPLLYKNSRQSTLIILSQDFIKKGFKKEKDKNIWLFSQVSH